MKIKIVGAGWFGCHLALVLLDKGHDVELHDIENSIFSGASGKIPARLHLGAPHYPRSLITQQACQDHQKDFLEQYGHLTRGVPINIYAIAQDESFIDFGTYKTVLNNSIESITIYDPVDYGLRNVEGAVLTGERHIVIDKAKMFFKRRLNDVLYLESNEGISEDGYDYVIDSTFCSNDNYMVDRFEPCLVPLLEGNSDKAVTIMDGPFPSLYPWNEDENLCSLSSARYTPISKECKTWQEARDVINTQTLESLSKRTHEMMKSMAHFYPTVMEYEIIDFMLSIRAMPLSKADTRLVDVVKLSDKLIRIRSGKIDAVIEAERKIMEIING